MCGRYSLSSDGKALVDEFGVDELADWSPRFNIAPSQPVPVLLQRGASLAATELYWGLVPAWAKDRKPRSRLINARAETVAEKPSFRAAFRRRRCLVLADGYYEWAKRGDVKQPYYIYPEPRRPFAFAGLWEKWSDEHGSSYFGCSIITCAANAKLQFLHHRMPVVLPKADHSTWLDAGSDARELAELLKPGANDLFNTLAVSGFVNSPTHEGPDCVRPLRP
jgi:putative SOS response-associated peptidase YedK